MRKITILFFFISSIIHAQDLIPSDKEVIINITIRDEANKPLQTKVFFTSETKQYSFETDINGKARFVVQIGKSYKIGISNSLTYYNYDIPDFPMQELKIDLEFELEKDKQNIITDKQALFILISFNLPSDKEIELIDENNKSYTLAVKDDIVKTVLPINKKYKVKIKGYTIENNLISIGNKQQNVLYYVLYISGKSTAELIKANDKAFLNVVYTNIFTNKVAPNEMVQIQSKNRKTIYENYTGENGTCLFIVPKNDIYYVHIAQAQKIITVKAQDNSAIGVYDLAVLYPTTNKILAAQKADSIRLAKRELAYEKRIAAKINVDKNKLKTEISEKAIITKEKIKENPDYFKETGNTVCAVIFRVRKKWNNKIIVTDITSSMYPYTKQLLLWHSLKLMSGEKTSHVFFNDGDKKKNNEKVLGKTGGIYYTDSDDNDKIIDVALRAMRNGKGGDGPENDIEALIYAQSIKDSSAELILIADNYSSVKDISLLSQIKVPVRVILCGTEWGIHPDYIEIAYKTNGSIHTIDADIMRLKQMVNGDRLKIGKYSFIYSNGKFFRE